VIIFILLTAKPPFNGPSTNVIFDSILNCNFTYPEEFEKFSENANDFLNSIFIVDP